MKIAILTQPLRTNYGGILQAYALQTVLQRRGHEVVVINREYQDYPSIKLLCLRVGAILKSLIRRYILGKREYIIMNPLSSLFRTKWDGYIVQPFVKKKICQSPEIRNSESMRRYFARQKFDSYIVGSDQVWRPCYSPCITDFFLKSVPNDLNVRRIAYAASFGTSDWEFSEEDALECARLAKLFDKISVREKSGVNLCKVHLGVQAEHVLDPTMLLDAEDYIRLFENAKTPKSESNLFCYVLDENKESERIINSLEHDGYKATYAKLFTTPTRENPKPCQLSVEEWLRGIYDSELVVTDSFHACVFSIIFKKPFIALGNNVRGNARFDSLFETFNLQDRLISSYDKFEIRKEVLMDIFDTTRVECLLQELRKKSNLFLDCIISFKNHKS